MSCRPTHTNAHPKAPNCVAFVVNPISGSSKSDWLLGQLVRRIESSGSRVHVLRTRATGDASGLAARAAREADVVVAVGGDGTVREAAGALLGTGVSMAVLPTGTENIFAREMGCRATLDSMWTCLTAGRRVMLDVGEANGEHFLVVAGAGFDAEVVERFHTVRRGHISHMDYFWPIWRVFWEHRFPVMRVEADGREVFAGRGLVFVGNLARYAIGLRILRDACGDDGALDLCVYPCRWQGRLVWHSAMTLMRRHVEWSGVVYHRVRSVRIESAEDVAMELDGDPAGKLPVEISVRPRALSLLLPRGKRGHSAFSHVVTAGS